jgi:hypothetical protein
LRGTHRIAFASVGILQSLLQLYHVETVKQAAQDECGTLSR